MRVHLVTDAFSLGGGLEHIYQVARGLKDIQFRVFGEPGPGAEKFKDLENVIIYDKGYGPEEISQFEPDLIHIHHLKPLAAYFKSSFRGNPVPVIFTAHGLHIHKYEFRRSLKARLSYFLRFQLEKRLFARAGRVIAVSREDKLFMEQKYRLNNVHYLTNGIDFQPIQAALGQPKKELREKLGFPASSFLFITVARFDFQKGYDVLIPAAARIKDYLKQRDCRFILAGGGSDMEAIKELCGKLEVQELFHFLGPRNDVYDILCAGDLCLLPSRWEGLPIVLLETGLLSTPVLASETYGNREIIGEKNGILFKNLDHKALAAEIKKVLENKYDLETMAGNLRREVLENYNLETMLKGLDTLYRDALN